LSSGSGASASEPDEGVWRTKGLPQHGFPFALATTWVRSDARAETTHDPVVLRVLRADPRAMTLATAQSEAPTVLSLAATMRGALTLWWSNGLFSIGASAPTGDAAALVAGSRTVDPASSAARAAVGVQDEDGMLVWVELPPDAHPDAATASAMDALLDRLGCSARMALGGDPHALLGGALDVAGNPLASPPPVAARLVRAQAPGAHAIFTDTPIVPIHVWQPLQAKRVRYFYKPAPLTPPLVSALTSPPTPPTQPANAAAVRSASHAHPSR
jgi:hypothetical protein